LYQAVILQKKEEYINGYIFYPDVHILLIILLML